MFLYRIEGSSPSVGTMIYTLQLITAFVAGGLLLSLQTLIGERVPLQWRGAVLGFPSTIALSLLFIGLTKSVDDIPTVTRLFTAAIAGSSVFVLAFTLLSKFKLPIALLGGYLAWIATAYLLITFPPHNLYSAFFVYALPVMMISYLLIKRLPQKEKLTPVPFRLKFLLVRAVLAGSIIVAAVILSKELNNIWGGIFAGFPAAFSATMIIYYQVHGKSVIPAVAKTLYFPGMLGLILYAWTASLVFPLYGVWLGTLLSYLAVGIFYLGLHGYRTYLK